MEEDQMSIYQLLPSPDIACQEQTHAYWENGFSPSQIAIIRTYGDGLLSQPAAIGPAGALDPDIRKTQVSWIDLNDQTVWLYDKLGYILRQINGQYFQFDLTGFGEHFQYTRYTGVDKSFYDWHMDKGINNGDPPRKLSMVVMLSDPSEYEGGDLQVNLGSEVKTLAKTQGIVHIFPTWILHRVTPVTKGTRRSLVIWACGSKFR